MRLFFCFILCLLPCAGFAQSGQEAVQKIVLKPWTTPVLAADAAGGFVGEARGGTVLAAAPTAAEDALPVWFLPAAGASGGRLWQPSDVTVAKWSASAPWGEKTVCAGGLVAGKPTGRVVAIGVEDGKVRATELAPLPVPVAGAGAAVIGKTLYVFGGASSLDPPAGEKTLWTLPLNASGATWKQAGAFPGEARAFCAAAVQGGMFYVFGGVTVPAGAHGASAWQGTAQTWVYRPVPLEFTSETGWRRMVDLPQPLAAARAVPLGQAQVLLAGGGNGMPGNGADAVAPAGPPQLFQVVTDAWCGFNQPLGLGSPLLLKTAAQSLLVFGRAANAGTPTTVAQEISFPRNVRSLSWIDYLVVAAYFVLIAGIGFYFSRQESSEEFSLGNRRIPWWAAGISMFATGASAISFMAIPALAFRTNLVYAFPVVMLVPAYFINAHYIFPLLRRMNLTSTYEYLERRFNVPLRLIASVQCILLQTFGRASVVLVLPALALSAVTGINVYVSVIGMGLLTTVYTALGGFQAVIWTEVFQGMLKLLAPLLMIGFCLAALPGGAREFLHVGLSHDKFRFALPTWDATVPALWVMIISFLLQFTIYKAGDQPIIQRVFSSPVAEVRRVTAMDVVCGILIGTLVNVLGLAIFAYFHAHPEKYTPGTVNDQVVPFFTIQAMPVGFAGLVVAAIFASAMSTVASAMNSVATIFTEDFYLKFRPGATDRQRLFTLRTSSYIVGFIGTSVALFIASLKSDSLMIVWLEITSLLGGGIVGVYSLGMFTRRANGFGAVGGVVISVVLTLLVKLYTPLHVVTYLPIAILSCIASGYALSFLAPQTKDLRGLTVWAEEPADAPSANPPTAVHV